MPGNTRPAAPKSASTTTVTSWTRSTVAALRGRRSAGSADAARIVPPSGRLSAPAACTSPFSPISTPGVASACTTSSTDITENANPSSTARPSLRRVAITDIAIAATPASAPAAATTSRCTSGGRWIITPPLAT